MDPASQCDHKSFLTGLFRAAIDAVHPAHCVAPALPPLPKQGRVIVIGAGKAAAAMAQAVEKQWAHKIDQGALSGLVITTQGARLPTMTIDVLEAAHPIPDARNILTTRRLMDALNDVTESDLVLVLLSGGGSALLCLPPGNLTLEDIQSVTQSLLTCGAPIRDINCVRKHLSAIKGGLLAKAAAPARLCTLAISDVTGDDPSIIASGPTVPDPTHRQDALDVVQRYGIHLPARAARVLQTQQSETPKPFDPCFSEAVYRLIATPQQALEAAARKLGETDYEAVIVGDAIEGEARVVVQETAEQARAIYRQGRRAILLSGGEVTVTQNNPSSHPGGPNREFALALALALNGHPSIAALVADTDGVDGRTDNKNPVAGGFVDSASLSRFATLIGNASRDAETCLQQHRSGEFFRVLNDEIKTGPTQTNVNDFRAILIDPQTL